MLAGGFWSKPKANLVFAEAGGAAALSAFSMLQGSLEDVQLIALDRDPAALTFWADMGAATFPCLSSMGAAVPVADCYFAPCDEYLRAQYAGLDCPWTSGDLHVLHDKQHAHARLSATTLSTLKVPARLARAVIRPRVGAGSRGLVMSTSHELVTEYIEPVAEYVVDANTRLGLVVPRQTHHLKNGGDTYVTVFGPQHSKFGRLSHAALEALYVLGIDGIANVQLLEDAKGDLWFVEASGRLSGTSWVCREAGVNLLTGEVEGYHTRLSHRPIHTNAGGVVRPPVFA